MADFRTPWRAVAAMFALNGALFGVWASRIPAFVHRLEIAPGQLGLVLLALACGAIAAFPLAGSLTDRLGAARTTRALAVIYVTALCLLPLAPSLWVLALILALFGSAFGGMDVAMNTWGAEVEARAGRPMMSSLHAMFSLGAGLGAASGYGAVRIGLEPALHFWFSGAILGALALWTAAIPWTSDRHEGGPVFALPRGKLALVGLVAFGSALGEGAMADWSAVFMNIVTHATEAQAALGYAAFSIVMVSLRLAGDRIVRLWGPVLAVRLSGVTAATGAVVALSLSTPAAAIAGFALMGAGYALVMPLAFSRAASDPNLSAGRAIASVATLAYGGMLAGPPLIGAIAALASLKAGFGLIALLALMISVLAGALAPQVTQRDSAPGKA